MSQAILPFLSDIDPDHDAFGHWLSGFTDGEGAFMLRIDSRTRRGYTRQDMGGSFVIGLRADELPIIERIRDFFGCGRVYRAPGHDRRGNVKPSVFYKVYKAADLMNVIVPHFLRYPLRAKKARDFAIWTEGVRLLFHVSQRKTVTRGYLQGTFPRWSLQELNQFSELVKALKEQREYRA